MKDDQVNEKSKGDHLIHRYSCFMQKSSLRSKNKPECKEKGFTSLLQKINERYRDQVNEKSKGDHVLRRYVNYVLC